MNLPEHQAQAGRGDGSEHRVDELLHQIAEAPERGLGTDPMTSIGTQTLSQAVEMLHEDVERERDRADRAERQVEEGRQRIDELQASLDTSARSGADRRSNRKAVPQGLQYSLGILSAAH